MTDAPAGEIQAPDDVSAIPSADGPDPWRPEEPAASEAATDDGDEVGILDAHYREEAALVADLGGREFLDGYRVMASSYPAEAQALRDEWRGDFGGNMEMARSLYASIRNEALDELLETAIDDDGRRLGDHPGLIRIAATLARQLAAKSGDPTTTPDLRDATVHAPQGRQAPSHVEAEIKRLRALQGGDWRAQREWEDPKTQAKLMALYEQRSR